jgi:hypothetical protein
VLEENMWRTMHTDKKEKKSFLIYREIPSGAVGFPIYKDVRKYFPIYEEAVSYI